MVRFLGLIRCVILKPIFDAPNYAPHRWYLMNNLVGQKNKKPRRPYHLRGFELHFLLTCDPAGIRTQDPYIKSVMLYQLSYEINPRICPSKRLFRY